MFGVASISSHRYCDMLVGERRAADEERHAAARSGRGAARPGRPSCRRRPRRRPRRRAPAPRTSTRRRRRRRRRGPRARGRRAGGSRRRSRARRARAATSPRRRSDARRSRARRARARRPRRATSELGAEHPRLLVGALGELGAAERRARSRGSCGSASSSPPGRRSPRARARACAGPRRRRRPPPQPGRAGADDDEVDVAPPRARPRAAGLRELGGRRIDEHPAVRERDRRSRVFLCRDDDVRNAQAGQRRLEIVGAPRARVGDHPRAGRAPPFRCADSCKSSEIVRWKTSSGAGCGAQDVEVDPAMRHRPQDELAERTVCPAEPGDQQAAPGSREPGADTGEQLRSDLPAARQTATSSPAASAPSSVFSNSAIVHPPMA